MLVRAERVERTYGKPVRLRINLVWQLTFLRFDDALSRESVTGDAHCLGRRRVAYLQRATAPTTRIKLTRGRQKGKEKAPSIESLRVARELLFGGGQPGG